MLLAFLGIVAAAIPNRAVRLTALDHSGNATLVLIAGAEGPIAQIGSRCRRAGTPRRHCIYNVGVRVVGHGAQELSERAPSLSMKIT